MHRNVFVVAGCSLYLEHFNIVVNDRYWLDRNLFAHSSRVLVVTEFIVSVVSGTQCIGSVCGTYAVFSWFLKCLESVSVSLPVSVSRWLQVFRNHSLLGDGYKRPSVTIY